MSKSPFHVALLAAVGALVPLWACSSEPSDDSEGGVGGTSAGKAGAAATGGVAGSGQGGSATGAQGGTGPTGSAGKAGSSAGLGGGGGTGPTGSGGTGTGGSGGTGAGGTAAGGTGAGGTGPTGTGGSSSGGSSSAGSAGVSAGGSAGSSAGSAGTGNGGGGGGGMAQPSAGCGKGGRPNGGVVTVTNDHIYTFPASYDGSKPFPLLIGMHAAGNPIDQIRNLTNGSDFETNYVRAFPKSAGNEWNYNNDRNKVFGMFDDLLENYCIDESRIFATGHSSGAQMIVQILTHADTAERIPFKAIAPVAASNYGAIQRAVPVMYIQGENDNVRMSDGADVVARFTAANSCDAGTMPYSGASGCSSSGTMVNPGCVVYQGCDEPTIWCSHNDPQYSNTNHGWPCFATRAMYDFFTDLP